MRSGSDCIGKLGAQPLQLGPQLVHLVLGTLSSGAQITDRFSLLGNSVLDELAGQEGERLGVRIPLRRSVYVRRRRSPGVAFLACLEAAGWSRHPIGVWGLALSAATRDNCRAAAAEMPSRLPAPA
jgi:hypothetical protein